MRHELHLMNISSRYNNFLRNIKDSYIFRNTSEIETFINRHDFSIFCISIINLFAFISNAMHLKLQLKIYI